eukprot:gene8204-9051_t
MECAELVSTTTLLGASFQAIAHVLNYPDEESIRICAFVNLWGRVTLVASGSGRFNPPKTFDLILPAGSPTDTSTQLLFLSGETLLLMVLEGSGYFFFFDIAAILQTRGEDLPHQPADPKLPKCDGSTGSIYPFSSLRWEDEVGGAANLLRNHPLQLRCLSGTANRWAVLAYCPSYDRIIVIDLQLAGQAVRCLTISSPAEEERDSKGSVAGLVVYADSMPVRAALFRIALPFPLHLVEACNHELIIFRCGLSTSIWGAAAVDSIAADAFLRRATLLGLGSNYCSDRSITSSSLCLWTEDQRLLLLCPNDETEEVEVLVDVSLKSLLKDFDYPDNRHLSPSPNVADCSSRIVVRSVIQNDEGWMFLVTDVEKRNVRVLLLDGEQLLLRAEVRLPVCQSLLSQVFLLNGAGEVVCVLSKQAYVIASCEKGVQNHGTRRRSEKLEASALVRAMTLAAVKLRCVSQVSDACCTEGLRGLLSGLVNNYLYFLSKFHELKRRDLLVALCRPFPNTCSSNSSLGPNKALAMLSFASVQFLKRVEDNEGNVLSVSDVQELRKLLIETLRWLRASFEAVPGSLSWHTLTDVIACFLHLSTSSLWCRGWRGECLVAAVLQILVDASGDCSSGILLLTQYFKSSAKIQCAGVVAMRWLFQAQPMKENDDESCDACWLETFMVVEMMVESVVGQQELRKWAVSLLQSNRLEDGGALLQMVLLPSARGRIISQLRTLGLHPQPSRYVSETLCTALKVAELSATEVVRWQALLHRSI